MYEPGRVQTGGARQLQAIRPVAQEAVAQGVEKKEAYRKAFGASGKSDAAVRKAVSRLSQDVTVLGKVEELGAVRDEEAGMARGERLRLLAEQARAAAAEGDRTGLARMIDIMNRMDGAYVAEAAAAGADAAFQAAVLRGCEEERVRR